MFQEDAKPPKILLYVTTLFSETHVKYLHCCWPQLLRGSSFLQGLDVIVFSNNLTEINATEIEYTQHLFSNQPSFHFRFATPSALDDLRQWNSTQDPNVTKRVNFKQWGANMAMMLGFSEGWFDPYDWIIRINPDVLIRSSAILRQNVNNKTVQAIVAMCGKHKVNTDYMAIRPNAFERMPFQGMYHYGKQEYFNHEHTAKRNLEGILNSRRAVFVPDLDPMMGKCRVRGRNAPIYHQHDSCNASDVCDALEGWIID